MKESKGAALLLQDLPCFSFNPIQWGFFMKKEKNREGTPLLLFSGVL